jgi:ubiquinone/menaquinone biosynthesis C-methylase UbiE
MHGNASYPSPLHSLPVLDVESAVRDRYAGAAEAVAPALCCPVSYDPRFLAVLPPELIERDYGCGDPSRHVRPGETVLDLGAGGGKICYISSQVVGPQGRVIGIDANEAMLALARSFQSQIAAAIGHDNVRFHKGRIQDLALDLEVFDEWLAAHPVRTSADWLAAESQADRLRRERPMVADATIDVVVSNCVLNLVRPEDRRRLFAEMFRVVKPGGRAVVSDITSDRPVPDRLQRDPQLWSGCVSGAHTEEGLLAAFAQAGFAGIEIVDRQAEPWTVVEGIEFRSLTVRAYKLPNDPAGAAGCQVVYRGPWQSVSDEQGRTYVRGARATVGPATAASLGRPPYAGQFLSPHGNADIDPGPTGGCGPQGCCG